MARQSSPTFNAALRFVSGFTITAFTKVVPWVPNSNSRAIIRERRLPTWAALSFHRSTIIQVLARCGDRLTQYVVKRFNLCNARRCTVKRAALALVVLVASTVALGQPPTSGTSAEPRTSTTPQDQKAPRMSKTDKLILITDCTRQVQAAHPSVPEKDVKEYCEDQLKRYSVPR